MSTPVINQTAPGTLLSVLADALETTQRDSKSVGLLIVHLENYDRLVSAFGYRLGNLVIAAFAERLQEVARPKDRVLRISDSKFALIINSLSNTNILMLAASKITQIFAKPIPTGANNITVDMRIGIAAGPDPASSAELLLQHAETALLAAVTDQRCSATYSAEQAERTTDSLRLEIELDLAIKRNEFELHYQPKISSRDFRPCGAEALIRWNNRKRGPVSPEVFIPIADRQGRMEPLTSFVLNTALRQASEWPCRGSELAISINVTPRLILESDLVAMVAGALKLWDFEPSRLIVEITEGAIMTDPNRSFKVLSELRRIGVKISIDDFGTGYSSLAYFKNIPANELKIDKSFVLNMFEDDGDKQIVKAIIELSRGFGLEVTAEGVEDQKTAALLAELRCDRLQGYHFSRPLPHDDFIAWLDAYERKAALTG